MAEAEKPERARRQRQISEDQIVAAALAIIRADGLSALTMRRLSEALGVTPMAAYHHVANKDDLLRLVVSTVLSEVRVPRESEGPWDVRLRKIVDALDRQIHRHPGIGDLIPEALLTGDLRLFDAILGILLSAGFADRDALKAYGLVHTYLLGRRNPRIVPQLPDRDAALPNVWKLRRSIGTVSGRELYAFGIEALVGGLRAQLESDEGAVRRPSRARRQP